jgi:hypothetical protein
MVKNKVSNKKIYCVRKILRNKFLRYTVLFRIFLANTIFPKWLSFTALKMRPKIEGPVKNNKTIAANIQAWGLSKYITNGIKISLDCPYKNCFYLLMLFFLTRVLNLRRYRMTDCGTHLLNLATLSELKWCSRSKFVFFSFLNLFILLKIRFCHNTFSVFKSKQEYGEFPSFAMWRSGRGFAGCYLFCKIQNTLGRGVGSESKAVYVKVGRG